MSESIGDSLDGMVMGEGISEQASESDEKFKARVAATQVKLKKIKKDETKAKNFDHQLAKILPGITSAQLKIIIFLIDHEIPSLTILAIISIANDEAGKVCYMEFEKYIESRADFSKAKLPSEIEEKVSYWWTFIHGADHVSNTVFLGDLKDNTEFISQFSKYLGQLLRDFLVKHEVRDFDEVQLKEIIQRYQKEIFAKTPQVKAPEPSVM